MTDAERRVLEGINDIAAQADDTIGHISAHFARTLKTMLAEPRPPQPTTDAEKAALEWLDRMTGMATAPKDWRPLAATIKAMLAEPRLPKEPSEEALDAMFEARGARATYRALYAHLTKPQVDFDALDEARMEPRIDAAVERAFFKSVEIVAGPHNCTPAARDDLRKAISVLRGWSAEAAGRTGLAESVLIVCNAAESTLPLQMYRIRGRNFEMVRAGPISISEVPND